MQAKFTEGSIMRHVSVMTFAATVGLLSLFFVDLVDMYWLSLLGIVELAAAIGYAGSILFFTLAVCIGLSIGCSAVVSQSIGRGDQQNTQTLVGTVLIITVVVTAVLAAGVFAFVPQFLHWLGANAEAHSYSAAYLRIILPSLPLMAVGMVCGGIMRALGHARESMYLTMIAGGVNAVLDPLFIFALGMGIEGAALATVCARLAMAAYGLWRIAGAYQLLQWPQLRNMGADAREYLNTALPAVLTNLATPIGVAYVTATMAQFGDSAVAGNTIVGRVQPLAFAGLFALSGSIGPIAGQNLGASLHGRIMETLRSSVQFIAIYCTAACLILFLLTEPIIWAFKAEGDAERLVRWFCYGFSSMFFFIGLTFITNALFNNLRLAHWATIFNFLRATLFTMPFAWLGAELAGPFGVLTGVYVGSALVALAGLGMCYYKIKMLQN